MVFFQNREKKIEWETENNNDSFFFMSANEDVEGVSYLSGRLPVSKVSVACLLYEWTSMEEEKAKNDACVGSPTLTYLAFCPWLAFAPTALLSLDPSKERESIHS